MTLRPGQRLVRALLDRHPAPPTLDAHAQAFSAVVCAEIGQERARLGTRPCFKPDNATPTNRQRYDAWNAAYSRGEPAERTAAVLRGARACNRWFFHWRNKGGQLTAWLKGEAELNHNGDVRRVRAREQQLRKTA